MQPELPAAVDGHVSSAGRALVIGDNGRAGLGNVALGASTEHAAAHYEIVLGGWANISRGTTLIESRTLAPIVLAEYFRSIHDAAEGNSLIRLNGAQRLAKGLIRTSKAKQKLIAMDGDSAELHHSPHNKPDAVLQKWNDATSGEMNKVAFLVAALQQFSKSVTPRRQLSGRNRNHCSVPRIHHKCMEHNIHHRQRDGHRPVKKCLKMTQESRKKFLNKKRGEP